MALMAYTPQSGPRKKHIGLSARELTKVTGTIASVRRNHTEDNYGDSTSSQRPSRQNDCRRDEPSFIAETSFVRAPLNSRVTSVSLQQKAKGKSKLESLDRVSLDVQEALILEDLLYVLLGIEGTFITFHPDYSPEDDDPLQGIRFVVSPTLDSSLRDLVERILPLGMYYTAITGFIELRSHIDYGLVNHALCAAVRDMLKDYQTLLSQLEHAFNSSTCFSLQKLWFYVHPTVHTLSLIYQLIIELESADEALDSPSPSPSPPLSDPEEEARNASLGLGGAKLKVVLSELTSTPAGASGIIVKGGEVLTIIYERMQNMSGDPTASSLYGALLRTAGRPYVQMIRSWVTTGSLYDPYEELLLKESKFINRGILDVDYTDEYWEGRYTLRDGSTLSSSRRAQACVPPPRSISGRLPGGSCVPPLLEGWKHKILLAGKYLNVIRECGIDLRSAENYIRPEDDDIAMDDERFYIFLESAYAHANRTLLSLLLMEQQLVPRLRTLKRLFFLSQSSYLTHMLDLAAGELRKPAKSVSTSKLQNLLELALDGQGLDAGGALVEGGESLKDVKVTMSDVGLYAFLMKVVSVSGIGGGEKGISGTADRAEDEKEKEREKDDKKPILAIDAFTLDYTIKFPLSLVVSRKTILRYQLLFRFLLHLKHAEQTLASMWLEQHAPAWRTPTPDSPEFSNWRRRVCLLRARMLAFVQQILTFATFEVLEPNWRSLEAKLARVRTVEELLRDHVDFLDTCLKECMLTSAKLIHAYSRLIVTCSTFAHYAPMFTKSAHNALDAMDTPEGDHGMAKRMETLGKFETNFNHWFQVHLNCVQYYASSENMSLLSLVVRLNSVRAHG